MTIRPAIALLLTLLAAGASGGLAACFSEHVQGPAAGQCVAPPDSTAQGSPLIHIINFAFQPAATCLDVGTTATWLNDDTQAHTSTADQGEWNSPLLNPGSSFTFTFAQAGTFAFHCTPHPFMQGTIVVR
jgi:plastocyanin